VITGGRPDLSATYQNPLDCLIVGGGPAGLTAALYLARFRRDVLVIDDGKSRAALIPESHNYPGFTDGVSGEALLARLADQARQYGARTRRGRVDRLDRDGELFIVRIDGTMARARRVLLATGIVDDSPDLPDLDTVVERGALRYCPICDAYEALDKTIGVLGRAEAAAKKALFLRTWSRDVTVLATDTPDPAVAAELAAAGVAVMDERVVSLARDGERICAHGERGGVHAFEVIYPALGCTVRSGLARALGARCDDLGLMIVDDKQKTSVAGLYAAGDVVSDLHQISVATGHAAIAATAIHNGLARNSR
jgi:thioredoxin reductase (NADPH)